MTTTTKSTKAIKPSGKTEEKEMSFLEHLEELRWHIIRSFLYILVVAITLFVFHDWVFDNIIYAPRYEDFATYRFFCGISETLCFSPPKFDLLPRELGEEFFVAIKTSFYLGFVVAFPLVFREFWSFVKPGLYDNERKAARGIVFFCSVLFIMGVLFGYYVIAPFGITFLAGFHVGSDTIQSPAVSSYVTYMTMFTLPTGLVFEMPIVVYFLSKVGLVTPDFMIKYRKHAIILTLMLAALITPPDVMTQILIGIPIYILYEVSILVAKRMHKKYQEGLEE